MFYLFSEDLKQTYELKKALLSKGLFFCAYSGRYDKFTLDTGHTADVFLIDARKNRAVGEEECSYLRTVFPESRIIALLSRVTHEASRFRYLKCSDCEIMDMEYDAASELVHVFLERNGIIPPRAYRLLKLGNKRTEAAVMSFPLALTQTEYRILGFLCAMNGRVLPSDLILSCCFADGYRLTPSNIPTHISSINQKAKRLTGRRLIITVKGSGYTLNPNM